MKPFLLILILVVTIGNQFGFAQSRSDKMYDFFDGKDGVYHFSFSKNMKDVVDIDLGDDDERKVTGDLHQIRFMTYNPQKGNFSGPAFSKKAVSLLPRVYKQYHDSDEEFENAQIWLLGKRKNYAECHLFFDSEEAGNRRFVVSFYGNFTVNDLESLTETGRRMAHKN